jgi:UDP-glucose 4-epimerase
MKTKKVAVIGSESFLARNFRKYIEKNISAQEIELCLYDYVQNGSGENYHQIDFMEMKSVSKIDFDVDYLMIFIGKTGTKVGFEKYQSFIGVNEIALLNILTEHVNRNSKATIIYPSTRLIYQSNDSSMIKEGSAIELKSIYAITKFSAEKYLELYSKIYGVKYVILRMCTPIGTLLNNNNGSYGTFEMFKNQINTNNYIQIYGDGNQRKTFTNVKDICIALVKLILAKHILYHEYNLGGKDYKLVDIAKKIAKDAPIKYVEWPKIDREVDGGSVVFDSSRFDNEFGMTYSEIDI